jgi:hypothetical protein
MQGRVLDCKCIFKPLIVDMSWTKTSSKPGDNIQFLEPTPLRKRLHVLGMHFLDYFMADSVENLAEALNIISKTKILCVLIPNRTFYVR